MTFSAKALYMWQVFLSCTLSPFISMITLFNEAPTEKILSLSARTSLDRTIQSGETASHMASLESSLQANLHVPESLSCVEVVALALGETSVALTVNGLILGGSAARYSCALSRTMSLCALSS